VVSSQLGKYIYYSAERILQDFLRGREHDWKDTYAVLHHAHGSLDHQMILLAWLLHQNATASLHGLVRLL